MRELFVDLFQKKINTNRRTKLIFPFLWMKSFGLQIEGWKEICLISKLGPTTYRLPLKMGNQSFHDFFDNCNCVPPPPSPWTFPLHFLTDFVNNAYKSFAAKIDKIRRRTMSNIPWNLGNSKTVVLCQFYSKRPLRICNKLFEQCLRILQNW